MNLDLILMSENDIAEFKKNVQCAFQKGFEDVFGKCEETILPEKDIDQSLNGKGSVAYKAVLDGETVGGFSPPVTIGNRVFCHSTERRSHHVL